MPPKLFSWWGRLRSAFILKSSAKKPLEEIVIKKVKTQSQGSSRQSANSGKFGFLEFLRYEYLLKSSWVSKMKWIYLNHQTPVKIWKFLNPPSLVFLNLDQPSVNLSTLSSLHKLNFSTYLSCSNEKLYNTKVVDNLMKKIP